MYREHSSEASSRRHQDAPAKLSRSGARMSSSSQRKRPLPVIDLGLLLGPNFRRQNAAPAADSNTASNQSAMDSDGEKPKATGSDSASQPEIKVCDDSRAMEHASENDKVARLPRVSTSSADGTARKLPVERQKQAIHDDQSAKLASYTSTLDRECPASDDSVGDEMTLTEMKALVNMRGPASITAIASHSKQEKRPSESAEANGEAPIVSLYAKKNAATHPAKKRGKRSITSSSTESKGATKRGAPANDEKSKSLSPKKQKRIAKCKKGSLSVE